jgi:flagellar basal-body rod modification protein FlgD
MIQSVSSVAPLADTSATTTDDTTSSATSSAQSSGMSALLAPNEFLSLLVDNLKYQDPLDPTSSADLLTQLASLSQVQTQQQIAETEQTSAAASLMGDTITGSDVSGSPITGVVSGFSLGTSGPTLDVGGSSVLLGNITAVEETSTSSTSTPSNVSGAAR